MREERVTTVRTFLVYGAAFFPFLILLFFQFFLTPSYFILSIYKIVYLVPPLFRSYFYKLSIEESVKIGFSGANFRKYWKKAVLWGILFSTVYALGFLFLKNYIPIAGIATSLGEHNITARNIVFIGIFTIVVNALLEEFFWRGFVYNELKKQKGKVLAYLITAIGFSLYHAVYFYAWLSVPLLLIALSGLLCYSFFMCFLFDKYKDLFTCWLIHALVDIVQISIGLYLFGLL